MSKSSYLTHSAWEYFQKLVYKKSNFKKVNFKQLDRKSLGESRVKTNIFKKFIKFYSKHGCFQYVLTTWVHERSLYPP